MSSFTMSRADVVRSARRTQIVEHARILFGSRGTTEVSVEDIAAAAGVARSTVYNHFSDRDEIVAACVEHGHRRLLQALDDALDPGDGDPVGRLVTIFRVVLEQMESTPGFSRVVQRLAGQPGTDGTSVASELAVLGAEIDDLIGRTLSDAVAAGRIRDDLGEHDLRRIVGRNLHGLLAERAHGPVESAADAARATWSWLLDGIGG